MDATAVLLVAHARSAAMGPNGRPERGRAAIQGEVRTRFVVILEVRGQDATSMIFVQHNHTIQTLVLYWLSAEACRKAASVDCDKGVGQLVDVILGPGQYGCEPFAGSQARFA